MISRTEELCRKLKPILGKKVDALWYAYLADSDPGGRADIEQTLALLAAKHLGTNYEPDRAPFPPPSKDFTENGDIELGKIWYAQKERHPFKLKVSRLREHLLLAGRSGSGKTNTSFILMQNLMDYGVNVLALDWKRGYRDLAEQNENLRVFTIGRDVSPFRFNPFIPPPGCEVQVYCKLIVDVVAGAFLGGEGVISLLVGGLDHLYNQMTKTQSWPTVPDLLAWLRSVKLKGRAAMWQASAERILVGLCYGEFASVLNTQDNRHIEQLLNQNVVMEMDGLSSASDRVMFSESLMLYLWRYLLARGPKNELTNMIILEEAHNLLLAKQPGARESVLEQSIRMIRQYGAGYVFVDQSPSLISRVAFANSYATIALSQKLRADVQTIAGAMNLSDEQKEAVNTLPVGTAIVRLADEHPEPFLIKVPRSPVIEGLVDDAMVRQRMRTDYARSGLIQTSGDDSAAITPIPLSDKKQNYSHPSTLIEDKQDDSYQSTETHPELTLSRESIRFLHDVIAQPLSTTVSRYQRLHFSRRRGNAIRHELLEHQLLESVPIATRSGQVMLLQLTEAGRTIAGELGLAPGAAPRAGLEHTYWTGRAADHFERKGYDTALELALDGGGFLDLAADRPGERVAVEVETGKSDIDANLEKLKGQSFDRIILLATSPSAVSACQRAILKQNDQMTPAVEIWTWLDLD